jgi:hypothetical protein
MSCCPTVYHGEALGIYIVTEYVMVGAIEYGFFRRWLSVDRCPQQIAEAE